MYLSSAVGGDLIKVLWVPGSFKVMRDVRPEVSCTDASPLFRPSLTLLPESG